MTLGLNCMVCLCLSGSEWCQECSGQDTGLRKKVIDRVRIVGGGLDTRHNLLYSVVITATMLGEYSDCG